MHGKRDFYCRECGSRDVVFDAWASWNPELQMWEVDATFDHNACNECGETDCVEETSLDEVEQ